MAAWPVPGPRGTCPPTPADVGKVPPPTASFWAIKVLISGASWAWPDELIGRFGEAGWPPGWVGRSSWTTASCGCQAAIAEGSEP